MNTLFRNASLLMPDGQVLEGCLGVAGNRIAFVGVSPEGFVAERVIDCRGDLLMPGFVNSHTHLPMTLFRSMGDDMSLHDWLQTRIWPLEDKLDGDACRWGTMLAMAEMLRGGVTACNDMYFFTREILEAVASTGMRALVGRAIIDQGLEERVSEVRSLYGEWHGTENDRIRLSVAPHAEYTCSDDTMRRCRELKQDLGLKFHIHVSETFDEHEACKERRGGKTVVQWLDAHRLLDGDALLAHCTHVELDDIARIAARDATVLHSPQSNCKLGSGIAPVPVMLAHGCRVALSTDGAASNNNLDMMEEMRFAALIHNGLANNPRALTSVQAIDMATRCGAQALGWDAGSLREGALADIVRIDMSGPHMQPRTNLAAHLAYSAIASDVCMTMVDGAILYESGEFTTIDVDRITAEVARIRDALA